MVTEASRAVVAQLMKDGVPYITATHDKNNPRSGGVMKQRHLMPKVREKFAELVNGYVETPPLEKYLVTPLLEDNPGTIGCFALAKKALIAQK